MKKRLLLAGGTGLIGTAIKAEALKQGWDVTILSRREGPGCIVWDPQNRLISLTESSSFDAIVNLAGTSIAGKRWTAERKKEIVESRVDACHTLEKYLKNGVLRASSYVGASAIGIYGDSGNELVDEKTRITPDGDWMRQTVLQWEEGHHKIEVTGIRSVILRIGIVLSEQGGALPEMLKTSSVGLLGYFGTGRQYWSWIHIDDLVNIVLKAISDEQMNGTYLAVSPNPVSNKEMVLEASRLYSPQRIVVPVPALILAMMLGEMRQMLLQSCKGYPARLLKEAFDFRYAAIGVALKDLLSNKEL